MKEWRMFEKILRNNGYILKRTRGSHCVFSNGDKTIIVNRDVNRMLAKRLIKEYDLSAEDYLRRYEEFMIKQIEMIVQAILERINNNEQNS